MVWIIYNAVPFNTVNFPRSLEWRHHGHDGVSNHQPYGCLLNRLFGCRSKRTSKLRVTGLCEGNSPLTGEFPAQRARNVENVSILWRHHVLNTHDRPHQWRVFSKYITPSCVNTQTGGGGGRIKNTYELLNLRVLKFSYVNKIHNFQWMGKIFCVEFQRSFEIPHKIS